MHRQLRKLLADAKSQTGFVLAMNLDIRGFSAFATKIDAAFAMVFLRKIFISLIDDFVPDGAFFKLTGDGLLVVEDFEEDRLMDTLTGGVRRSLAILEAFPKLCSDDPMIPFETPNLVGIGLAWGTASSLRSDDLILDYSGQPLNLASRLMEVARPSGVVFDTSFRLDRFPADLAELFATDEIHVKGITTGAPLTVHFTKELTEIPDALHRPFDKPNWASTVKELTFKELKEDWAKSLTFRARLDEEPLEPGSLTCRLTHPAIASRGRRHPKNFTHHSVEVDYADDWGYPGAVVEWRPVVTTLEKAGVRPNWPLTITFRYTAP